MNIRMIIIICVFVVAPTMVRAMQDDKKHVKLLDIQPTTLVIYSAQINSATKPTPKKSSMQTCCLVRWWTKRKERHAWEKAEKARLRPHVYGPDVS